MAAGLRTFASRVANGEFDATKEEKRRMGPEPIGTGSGQTSCRQKLRKVLGLDLNN